MYGESLVRLHLILVTLKAVKGEFQGHWDFKAVYVVKEPS